MFKTFFAFFLAVISFVLLSSSAGAIDKDQFITIVNPVRSAYYTRDLEENLRVQYRMVSKRSLPATWLLTYDVLERSGAVNIIKSMDADQEVGLFMEVTPDFAKAAGVSYVDSGSWHYANSIFLSGYSKEERLKLIDVLFEKFKNIFGYYPTSVGSWWTDSYSLSYMKDKYGVTANLTCSDQFETDGYQLWGQYWSTPYYPSKYHTGIPAPSKEVKLDVVNLQWAPRDPLNGYYSSLYSTQDYLVLKDKQDINYFEKLVKLYASKNKNRFGQITVGLEGDLAPSVYQGEYSKQLDVVKKLVDTGDYQTTTMAEFSRWYRSQFPDLSPSHLIESEDLLGTDKSVQWYQSPRFRMGVVYDHDKKEAYVIDLRGYYKDFKEPYYDSPNRERILYVNIPSIFDVIQDSANTWKIPYDSEIETKEDSLTIKAKNVVIPEVLVKAQFINSRNTASGTRIIFGNNWLEDEDGYVFNGLTLEAKHFFASWRFLLELIKGRGWNHFIQTRYLVSQSELDALYRLSVLPYGNVLVYDKECLQCSWHTRHKPAVFANNRKYVSKLAKKPIVQDQTVFDAPSREIGRKELEKTGAKYVYVVRYEDYIEKIPFSPGDYNLEKVYGNANAEIWKVEAK